MPCRDRSQPRLFASQDRRDEVGSINRARVLGDHSGPADRTTAASLGIRDWPPLAKRERIGLSYDQTGTISCRG